MSAPALAALVDPTWKRLNRLALWCRSGRLAEAELELYTWRRQAECPAVASVLLAALLARRNKLDDALHVLRPCIKQHAEEDAAVGQLLVSVLVKADLLDAARRAALRLHHTHGDDPSITAWVQLMGACHAEELNAVPDVAVEVLAAELYTWPRVIPTLTVAAQRGWSYNDVALLRRAIDMAAADLSEPRDQLMICRAMAQLALAVEDHAEVRRWAHRGLRIEPYCATLALALAKVSDDPAVGPAAREVLARAAEEHPAYADVQAALIRREAAEGHGGQARRRLAIWLERQPDHPLARQVHQELAA